MGGGFSQTTEFKIIYSNITKCYYVPDLFFVISGFFIIFTELYKYNISYIFVKRALRFWPTMMGCLLIAFICSRFDLCEFYGMQNTYSLLFVSGIRIAKHVTGEYLGLGNLHSTWFLSVLMFSTIFYASLLKFYKEKFVFIAIVTCTMSLYQASHSVNVFFDYSVLRGLGSVGLGCLIGLGYTNIKNIFSDNKYEVRYRVTTALRILLTLIQIGLFVTLFISLFVDHKGRFVMTDVIVIFSLLFCLLLVNQDYFSRLLNNNISSFLGKYAFSIYISHCVTLDILKNTIINPDVYTKFCSFVAKFVSLPSHQFVYFLCFYLLNVLICVTFGILIYYVLERPIRIKIPQWIPRG